jgi:hypothetical protein
LVGIDGYYSPSETFFGIFGETIAQVRGFTGLPVLLSEVAVGSEAGQARKIPDLFAGMRQYGRSEGGVDFRGDPGAGRARFCSESINASSPMIGQYAS